MDAYVRATSDAVPDANLSVGVPAELLSGFEILAASVRDACIASFFAFC